MANRDFHLASNVKVGVVVAAAKEVGQVGSECGACGRMLRVSGLVDVVKAVNWREIEMFDLEKIVSPVKPHILHHFLMMHMLMLKFAALVGVWVPNDECSF